MIRGTSTWSSGYSVITGAGSGFGRALALELGRRGSQLLLSDVNPEALKETADLCRDAGARDPQTLLCDVREPAQVQALVTACAAPVHLLVNNAGVSSAGLVGEVSLTEWRRTVEIDLFGVIHGCHAFVPVLKKQGFGHVLNVASAAGFISGSRMAPYCVSKAGVIALSECMAAELWGTGVGITVLCPTFFKTRIVADGHYADEESRVLAQFMMSRGKPVAQVVQAALSAVERQEFYCVPMPSARWLWRLKRAAPGWFGAFISKRAREYLLEKAYAAQNDLAQQAR